MHPAFPSDQFDLRERPVPCPCYAASFGRQGLATHGFMRVSLNRLPQAGASREVLGGRYWPTHLPVAGPDFSEPLRLPRPRGLPARSSGKCSRYDGLTVA